MPRAPRLVVAVIALLFFSAPAWLLLGGVRARPLENRGLAPRPDPADGWRVFSEATKYVLDHLPGRDRLIPANTWILEHVFATTPHYGPTGTGAATGTLAAVAGTAPDAAVGGAPSDPSVTRVVRGLDGWLFYGWVFDHACPQDVANPLALQRWAELLSIVRASGRNAFLVVVPEKSTIYPEFVPRSDPRSQCGLRASTTLWRVLESAAAGRAGVVGLRRALVADKSRASRPLYLRYDTHWTGQGSLSFAETLLPAISRTERVLPSEIVRAPDVPHPGDLSRFLGQVETEPFPMRKIIRRAGAPTIPGTTLFIGDSFQAIAAPQLAPYFAHPYFALWSVNTTTDMINGIAASRTVVIETAERAFGLRALLITPEVLATLRARLGVH